MPPMSANHPAQRQVLRLLRNQYQRTRPLAATGLAMPQLPANHPPYRQVLRLLRNRYQHIRAARATARATTGPANPRPAPRGHWPMDSGPQNPVPSRCRFCRC